MAETATHSVDIVFWKATAFACWRAMDRRWNRNTVSLASSVMAVMCRPISQTSSMAKPFHVPAVSTATGQKMCVLSIIIIIIIICNTSFLQASSMNFTIQHVKTIHRSEEC